MVDNIRVVVRLRPLNSRETALEHYGAFAVAQDSQTLLQCGSNGRPAANLPVYTFDRVYPPDCSNIDVFNDTAKEIINSTLEGVNGTIFTYGQTSSGKTHTMLGSPTDPGIIPLAVREVFNFVRSTPDREFLLRVAYMEIYNEAIRDLLQPANENLKIHETATREIFVGNLTEEIVLSENEVMNVMAKGEEHRRFGVTNMNERSSRSHTIFRMIIESRERGAATPMTSKAPSSSTASQRSHFAGDGAVRVASLNLVDLAGSERVRHTGAEGLRLKEGGHINKSLLTLATVIGKLSEGNDRVHVPFRDSKLTRILQTSLGGNARTVIVGTITPASGHVDETHSTLKFASRAKEVKNKPQVNEVLSEEALLKKYQNEITTLRRQLNEIGTGDNVVVGKLKQQQREEELIQLETQKQKIEEQNVQIIRQLQEKERQQTILLEKMQKLATLILNSNDEPAVENDEGDAKSLAKKMASKRRKTWFPGMKSSKPSDDDSEVSSRAGPVDFSKNRHNNAGSNLDGTFHTHSPISVASNGSQSPRSEATLTPRRLSLSDQPYFSETTTLSDEWVTQEDSKQDHDDEYASLLERLRLAEKEIELLRASAVRADDAVNVQKQQYVELIQFLQMQLEHEAKENENLIIAQESLRLVEVATSSAASTVLSEQLLKLEQQCEQLVVEREQLKATVAEVAAKLESVQHDIEAKDGKIATMADELDLARQQYDQMVAAKEEQDAAVESLQGSNNELLEIVARLQQDLEDNMDLLVHAQQEASASKDTIAGLEQEHADYKGEIIALKSRQEDLCRECEQKVVNAEEQALLIKAAHSEEILALRSSHEQQLHEAETASSTTVGELQTTIEQLQAALDIAGKSEEQQVIALQGELEQARATIQQLNETNATAEQEAEQTLGQLSELEATLSERDEQLRTLSSAQGSLHAQVQELQSTVSSQQGSIAALEGQLAEKDSVLNAQIAREEEQLQAMEAEIAALKHTIKSEQEKHESAVFVAMSQAESRVEEMEAKLQEADTLQQENDRLRSQLAELEGAQENQMNAIMAFKQQASTQLKQVVAERAQLQQQVRELDAQVKHLSSAQNANKENQDQQLCAAQEENTRLASRIAELEQSQQTQLETFSSFKKDGIAKYQALAAQAKELERDKQTLSQDKRSLQEFIEELQAENTDLSSSQELISSKAATAIESLEKQLAAVLRDHNELKSQLETAQQANSQRDAQLKALQAEFSTQLSAKETEWMEAQSLSLSTQATHLAAERNALKEQAREQQLAQQKQLQSLEQTVAQHVQMVCGLQGELSTTNARNAVLQKRIQELDAANAQLKTVQQTNYELQLQLRDLQQAQAVQLQQRHEPVPVKEVVKENNPPPAAALPAVKPTMISFASAPAPVTSTSRRVQRALAASSHAAAPVAAVSEEEQPGECNQQ